METLHDFMIFNQPKDCLVSTYVVRKTICDAVARSDGWKFGPNSAVYPNPRGLPPPPKMKNVQNWIECPKIWVQVYPPPNPRSLPPPPPPENEKCPELDRVSKNMGPSLPPPNPRGLPPPRKWKMSRIG